MKTTAIKIKTPNGEVETQAIIVGDYFAVHGFLPDSEDDYATFNITHVPTGLALCSGFKRGNDAYTAIKRVVETMSEDQRASWNFTDPKKGPKALGKKIAKYLQAAKNCENNKEVEAMVGVFYRDREAAERLRMKINPAATKLMDDKALGSEKLTADLIFGKISL